MEQSTWSIENEPSLHIAQRWEGRKGQSIFASSSESRQLWRRAELAGESFDGKSVVQIASIPSAIGAGLP